jgi:hypothetical protein
MFTPLPPPTTSGGPLAVDVNGSSHRLNAASSPPAASKLPSGDIATDHAMEASAVTLKNVGAENPLVARV